MAEVLKILEYFGLGALLTTSMTLLFHWLSLKRQFRQSLDQKMIDRISLLVEKYYAQVSSSSEILRNSLNQALWLMKQKEKVVRYVHICFYHLVSYLHYCDLLIQERPRPLFTEIEAEMDYKQRIHDVYDGLPFDFYDISLLLNSCRNTEGLLTAHEFVAFVDKDKNLNKYYDVFSQWIHKCDCKDDEEKSCDVHQVIYGCFGICAILEDQMHKMYRIWYDRRVKGPKMRKKQNYYLS